MFLGEEKSIKRNSELEMVGRCSRDGTRCRWILDIYIYDARKISLDLDEFSIKKKSIDVIQNSNPAKSEEREKELSFSTSSRRLILETHTRKYGSSKLIMKKLCTVTFLLAELGEKYSLERVSTGRN